MKKVDTAVVRLWGDVVGAVSWLADRDHGVVEFDRAFLRKGLDIAPIHMPLNDARSGDGIFAFPALNRETFVGLPGLLADALPDKFGNRIIDAWLARNGRDGASFSPVERLSYTGIRGMGALEFAPAMKSGYAKSVPIEVSELVGLAQEIMRDRASLTANRGATEKENAGAMADILRVGTSAGGARPKAVIAMNGDGNVMSGQVTAPEGYDYWILKFDGVDDLELGKSKDYGRIEYAYHQMAKAAGIAMMESRLLEENGRAHFMTKRFDRVAGEKIHVQTLCGIAHYDFNQAGAYSYEQAFAVMRKLRLSKAEAGQMYRRMVFNVIARNQDDHTKNIAFLMGQDGKWRLSPAYDVMYSHNPGGKWTSQHQMTLNGKRDHFTRDDLVAVAESISLSKPGEVLSDVLNAVGRWSEFAGAAGVKEDRIGEIGQHHRLGLLQSVVR